VYYPIGPGQQAVISFHLNGSPITNGVVPDLVYFGAFGNTANSLTFTTYSFFDGSILLGTTIRTGIFSMTGQAFRSSDNLFPSFPGAPLSEEVDFSSILDGTIQGVLVIEPTFTNPMIGDKVMLGFQFQLLRQVNLNGGASATAPIIDSIETVNVPEPSWSAWAALGVFCLVGRASRRFLKS
jgi:hypothetical protein